MSTSENYLILVKNSCNNNNNRDIQVKPSQCQGALLSIDSCALKNVPFVFRMFLNLLLYTPMQSNEFICYKQ